MPKKKTEYEIMKSIAKTMNDAIGFEEPIPVNAKKDVLRQSLHQAFTEVASPEEDELSDEIIDWMEKEELDVSKWKEEVEEKIEEEVIEEKPKKEKVIEEKPKKEKVVEEKPKKEKKQAKPAETKVAKEVVKKFTRVDAVASVLKNSKKYLSKDALVEQADVGYEDEGGKSNMKESKWATNMVIQTGLALGVLAKTEKGVKLA